MYFRILKLYRIFSYACNILLNSISKNVFVNKEYRNKAVSIIECFHWAIGGVIKTWGRL